MINGYLVSIIVGLVVFFILISLLFHFARKVFKWALVVFLLLTIASAVFGVNILKDAYDLKEKLPSSQKLFILTDDQTVLAGFEGKLYGSDDAISYLDENEVALYQTIYNRRDFSSLKSTYYKTFIIDLSAFDGLSGVVLGDIKISTPEFVKAFRSDDTNELIIKQLLSAQGLPSSADASKVMKASIQNQLKAGSETELKGAFFSLLFSSASVENPLFIIAQFQAGNMVIFPETIIFKVLRYIPSRFIEEVFSSIGVPGG